MAYVVLARKWRSAQFSDVVGQSHVVRTLMNAIRSERLHQAYLLTGSRGIGKTSIARIFAKAIRCPQVRWDGEWLVSCDTCSSCQEIAAGNSVDVIEIDGASNNGVDAVREIRENAKFLPASGEKKVYIIDEVHMLTTAAFNALLKTLEEPPPHVTFVFATTEPHKIPATILSRVQRFDLKRHTIAQIQPQLAKVCQAEGLTVEAGALSLVARAAEGSMRDALSLLDQVIAFSDRNITVASTRESVGLIEGQALIQTVEAILKRDPKAALAQAQAVYQQGHDLKTFARSLIEVIYATILCQVGAQEQCSIEFGENDWKEIQSLAPLRPLEDLEVIFQAFQQGAEWITRSPQPKVVLDILLVKCATAESLVRVGSVPTAAPQGSGGIKSHSSPQATIAQPQKVSAPMQAAPPTSAAPQTFAGPTAAPTAALPKAPANGPKSWEGLIEFIRVKRPLLATFLEHATLSHIPEKAGDPLEVIFSSDSKTFYESLQGRVYAEQLVALSQDYFGFKARVQTRISDGATGAEKSDETVAQRKERTLREREQFARDAVYNHPIITEARSLFGGELGPIELIENADLSKN
jgi:DNA polymerase-3 subunit gamma/tau